MIYVEATPGVLLQTGQDRTTVSNNVTNTAMKPKPDCMNKRILQ